MSASTFRGSGASGWCLGRKDCGNCKYAACTCECHGAAS